MDFPLTTEHEGFSSRQSSSRVPAFPSLSSSYYPTTSPRLHMPSPRKTKPPEDDQRANHFKQSVLQTASCSVVSNHPATPHQSPLQMLKPLDFTRYEAQLRECVVADKERRERKFIPLHCVERVQMPASYFLSLDKALGFGELDSRYFPLVINMNNMR